MSSGPLVDGTDVEARRAADAVEGLASYLVRQHVRTPIVHEDQVELLRPIALRHAGPERGVRVHPLRGRGAGEEVHKDLEVPPLWYDLLYPHQGHEDGRQRRAHPAVALRLHDADRPRLGHGEVRARDADLSPEELLAQVQTGRLRQVGGLVGEVFCTELLLEELLYLRAVLVDRRDQDVRACLPCELDDELGEIGLEGVNALPLQILVELGLVRRYGLNLDDLFGAVVFDYLTNDPVRLVRVARPVDLAPGARYGIF